MNRKIIIAFVALIGMAMQGIAQVPFGVGFPSPNNFVKVTATGVNLRKAPSTSSPRLIFRNNVSDDCLDCDPSLTWSSRSLRKGDKPINPKLLYIMGESGDWWYVKYYQDAYGDGGYSEKGYIMKKFCKRLTPRSLPLSAPKDKNIVVVTTGKYEGLCLEWLFGYEDRQILRIGRFINGVYAFAYSITFSKNYLETKDTQFENNDYVLFGIHLFNSNDQLDLHKLANDTKTLDFLIDNRGKMVSDEVTYLGFEADNKWYQWGN